MRKNTVNVRRPQFIPYLISEFITVNEENKNLFCARSTLNNRELIKE